ncbi:MAG: tRNA pseudouridine(55) synthase TruB [Mycobacteriales bacterium]
MTEGRRRATAGLVVVDKPAGWTSHDVVSRMRRLAGTRRVGHAGTLDPMATGVLVLGVERATKLLGHLALERKAYRATVRLGQATVTDDAEGELVSRESAEHLGEDQVARAMTAFTGEISQVPSSVSAIKVAGQRAYAKVRRGEEVELTARRVQVDRFELLELRPGVPGCVDVDVLVECSSGTYVRALARDLGGTLGVGGHLTALRRTRVGPYTLDQACGLDELAALADPVTISLSSAVESAFPRRDVTAPEARYLSHGGRLPAAGIGGTYGVFAPDGTAIALVEESGEEARPVVVFSAGQ